MNRRKYVSAILGMGSLIGLSRYNKKESKATLTGFRINNTDENNIVSLSTGSESINGLNLNFNNFNIETRNISQIDKDITVNIYARIENNDYSDIIESINVSLSDSSESLNNVIDSVIILNENLIGNFPTVNEDMKELYIKIEMNHDDFSNPEIFETNISLNIEKQDIIAEGGNEIYDIEINNIIYRVHAYTEVGTHTFDVSNADGEVDVLVIGGGGAGGLTYGSGGGAGGLVFEKNKDISEDKISVVVGDGGTSGKQSEDSNNSYIPGEPGNDSSFGDITAIGGGGGATDGDYSNGNGGSGGGGGSNTALQPSSDSGGLGNEGDTDSRASGGGGAGESGIGAIGGDGVKEITINDIVYNFADLFGLKYGEIHNNEAWFAGGGVAQRYAPDGGIDGGGIGGGGSGEENPPDRPNLDRIGRKGMSNTGGGGGGVNTGTSDAGNGGTGIVLVRYPVSNTDADINPNIIIEDFERNIALRDWGGNTDNWNLERVDSLNRHQSISTNNSSVNNSVIFLNESVTGRLPKRGDRFSLLFNYEDITDESLIGFGMDSNEYNPNSGKGYAVNIGNQDKLHIYKDGVSQNSTTLDTTQYNTTIEIEINWLDDGTISVTTFEFNTFTQKREDMIDTVSITDSEYDMGVLSLATGENNSKRIFDRLWIIE